MTLLDEKLKKIQILINNLKDNDKLSYLINNIEIKNYIKNNQVINKFIDNANSQEKIVILSIIAIEEESTLFSSIDKINEPQIWLHRIAQSLILVEKFYDEIGGIIGYHAEFLKLLLTKVHSSKEPISYLKPDGLNVEKETPEVLKIIKNGIESILEIIEIYPVGGAGERLGLENEETHEPLPVARLQIGGEYLLNLLIRDLQAREFLYFKLFGRSIIAPVAMMTSWEKNNYSHILEICEENKWWGRSANLFRFFVQPLVPLISEEGHWILTPQFEIGMKPGGHGVIWKLAIQEKIFEWAKDLKRTFALIRQINNPVAGTDHGLIALIGAGWKKNKSLGFASCPRIMKTAQGMNVLVEKKVNNLFYYCITNVEYTAFEEKGIKDAPEEAGSRFSKFPANTNILFASLEKIEEAVKICPFPGLMINTKSKAEHFNGKQNITVKCGRLESMMQNIADVLVDESPNKINENEHQDLQTFLTYNDQKKTISVTKRAYDPSKPLHETPEGCFYDMMLNARDLLSNYCGLTLPELESEFEYIEKGPKIYFTYHPALGPLYSVIKQKVLEGELKIGSSLELEISEIELINLKLDGSLRIIAKDTLGRKNNEGIITYDNYCGKCELFNVTVKNKGINREKSIPFYKNHPVHQESLTIILHGNGEFHAENVTFLNDHHIEVQDGQRMTAVMSRDGSIKYYIEKIVQPTWKWDYKFDDDNKIVLKKTRYRVT